jgi:hypothetical protein
VVGVAWWVWLLLMWPLLATVSAVVLGRAIRTAERRDLGLDRPDDLPSDEAAA